MDGFCHDVRTTTTDWSPTTGWLRTTTTTKGPDGYTTGGWTDGWGTTRRFIDREEYSDEEEENEKNEEWMERDGK